MSDLKQIIDKHLKGIDEDNRNDDSWFPTSEGAEFGRVTKEALTKELIEREAKLANMLKRLHSHYIEHPGFCPVMHKQVLATLKSLALKEKNDER